MPWLWHSDIEGQPEGELPNISTDGISPSVLAALHLLKEESLDELQEWNTNSGGYRKRDRDPTSRINTPDGTV